MRVEKAARAETGGGPPTQTELRRPEERAMACWGSIVVDGHPNISPVGCWFDEAEVVTAQSEGAATSTSVSAIATEVNTKTVSRKRKRVRGHQRNDDLNEALQLSEHNRQLQTDAITNRLDLIIETFNALVNAQNETAAAIRSLHFS